MATPDHSPCLKRVLQFCQHAAMTSLHGPGPNCYLNDAGGAGVDKVVDPDDDPPSLKQLDAHTKHELYTKTSFKKLLLYEDSRKNKVEDTSRRSVGTDSMRSPTTTAPATHTPSETQPNPPKGKDASTSTSPGGEAEDSWVEPGVFLAPPPFPPLPVPVLAVADKGSPGAGREETLLDGEPIACFSVGGEKRLCLPQILNTVLREFSLSQINAVCDELQIYCSRCTPAQLDALRCAGVLPHTAISCGLITNTDAQRLTQALLYSHPVRTPGPPPSQRPDHPQLRVYHTCFGKCKGLVWEDLYTGPDAACIECEECHGMLQPSRFVAHAHRNLENRTIHWGFDAEQWRTYLLMAKDQHLPLEKAEAQLKAFKNKFGPVGSKRKQDGVEVKEELPKKVRAEEVPPTPTGYPYAAYDPLMLPYMLRCPTLPAPSWTATPLVTRDGKALPPPPPSFVRDSVPMPVPPYLSQGPPILADPGRVVPLSDSLKFERHYQPNVALAPPKVRDAALRDADHCHDTHHNTKLPLYVVGRGVDCIKREISLLPCPPPQSLHKVTQTQQHATSPPQNPPSPSQHPSTSPCQTPARKVCSPDTSTRHPELELSTTDSDTDSVNSLCNHSETVEEAEGLLRGWSDRAAACKVKQLVADLVSRLTAADHQNAILKRRLEAQSRDHTASALHTQNKVENGVGEKVSVMEGGVGGQTPSVITPISPIKTEPSDVVDNC